MSSFDDINEKYLAMGYSEEIARNLANDELGLSEKPEWMNETPTSSGEKKATVRSLIEQDFIDGGRSSTIDPVHLEEEHGVMVTPQNITSALKRHIRTGERLKVTRDDEGYWHLSVESKTSAPKRAPTKAILEERDRVCRLLSKFVPEGQAREMLMIIVRNGGDV